MTKVYIDCNILIDWLVDREPFSHYASKIIELTEKKKISSYISALTLANTYYVIAKVLGKKISDQFLNDSVKLFRFVDMPENVIRKAIEKKFRDFEDDLHYYTSVENKLDFIITRNKKDFKSEDIVTIDAEEFIKKHENAR